MPGPAALGSRSNQNELQNVKYLGAGPLNGATFGQILAGAETMINSGVATVVVNGVAGIRRGDLITAMNLINGGEGETGNHFHECYGTRFDRFVLHSLSFCLLLSSFMVPNVACVLCGVQATTARRWQHRLRLLHQ